MTMKKIILNVYPSLYIGSDEKNPGCRISGPFDGTFNGIEWKSTSRRGVALILQTHDVIVVSFIRTLSDSRHRSFIGIDAELAKGTLDSECLFLVDSRETFVALSRFKTVKHSRHKNLVTIPSNMVSSIPNNIIGSMLPVCGVKPLTYLEKNLFVGLADVLEMQNNLWEGNSVSTCR